MYKYLFVLLLFTASCSNPGSKAQQIVDQAIKAHGVENLDNVEISFNFRNRLYTIILKGNDIEYRREFSDSVSIYKDVLKNNKITREIDELPYEFSEEEHQKYYNTLNALVYFVLLPHKLNDPAVIKKYIGESVIKGKKYHKIGISFKKEGGGEDYDDKYYYFFNQADHKLDYFAYSFSVNGGGKRFRAAENRQIVKGITFQDQTAYTSTDDTPVEDFENSYMKGKLKVISNIKLKNIKVKSLK